MTTKLLLQLIHRFVGAASKHARQLRLELQKDDLLLSVKSKTVPATGILGDGTKYTFHGVGCSIESGEGDINFDFGPYGRCDGFDGWRLSAYARQFSEFTELRDREVVEAGLIHLVAQGIVMRPEWEPSPHLLYLAKSEPPE
jgi:hypothetical protein